MNKRLGWIAIVLAIAFNVPYAITPARMSAHPARTIAAAATGALSGLAQAVGLWRWVFVVPDLARAHVASDATAATRSASEAAFAALNQYGGVAIGEHLGQLLPGARGGVRRGLRRVAGGGRECAAGGGARPVEAQAGVFVLERGLRIGVDSGPRAYKFLFFGGAKISASVP